MFKTTNREESTPPILFPLFNSLRGKGHRSQGCPSEPSSRGLQGELLSACHRPSGRVLCAPVLSIPGAPAPPTSSAGPRRRTKAPMALAWPERSSWSWRCPRRYRYSMRSTSERGRQACLRNSARTRASAPGFPRPARSSSRNRLSTCLCSRLCRLMAAAGRWVPPRPRLGICALEGTAPAGSLVPASRGREGARL
uniref:Uncharacterized protein n=1 Tax=Prolemur simus TaxID=1328070 RepID=A0A8C8YKM6_PROSS